MYNNHSAKKSQSPALPEHFVGCFDLDYNAETGDYDITIIREYSEKGADRLLDTVPFPTDSEKRDALERFKTACELMQRVLPDWQEIDPMFALSPCHPCYQQYGFRGAKWKMGLAIDTPIPYTSKSLFKPRKDDLTCHWQTNSDYPNTRLLNVFEACYYIACYGLTPAFRDNFFCLDIDSSFEDYLEVVEELAELKLTFFHARTTHGGHILFAPNQLTTSTGNKYILPSGREIIADHRGNGKALSVWGLLRAPEWVNVYKGKPGLEPAWKLDYTRKWEWEPHLVGSGSSLSPLPDFFFKQYAINQEQKRATVISNLSNRKYTHTSSASTVSWERVLSAGQGERNDLFTRYIYGYALGHTENECWMRAREYLTHAIHPISEQEVRCATEGALRKACKIGTGCYRTGDLTQMPAPPKNLSIEDKVQYYLKEAGL